MRQLAFVVLKYRGRHEIPDQPRERALAQWTRKQSGPIVPKYTCRFNYADKHDVGLHGSHSLSRFSSASRASSKKVDACSGLNQSE